MGDTATRQRTSVTPAMAADTTRRRSPVAWWTVLALSASLIAAIAIWGFWLRTSEASVGVPIEYDGGTATVNAAWVMDDPMRLMHPDDPDKFAAAGMPSMSMAMSDAVPEGFKRVAVEVLLRAGDAPMEFPAAGVALSADGERYAPTVSMLSDEELTAGNALDALAIFEVPVETGLARFHLAVGAPPIALDLSGGHSVHDE